MLEEELDHQRTLYEKHLEYFDTLFAAIRYYCTRESSV